MKDKFTSLNIDFIGFCASALCTLHCALTPVLLAALPLAGLQFLSNPIIELTLIIISVFIASYALLRGFIKFHKNPLPLVIIGYGFLLIILARFAPVDWQEVLFSCLVASSVAVAHIINWVKVNQHYSNMTL